MLSIALAVLFTHSAHAQNSTRSVVPNFQPQVVQPQQQFAQPVQPRSQQIRPHQQMSPRQGIPGQGTLMPQAQYQNYRPVIGSGLPGAQKDGCNCFQLPDFDTTPAYDPYASKNYWTDICPNGQTGGGCPSGGCGQPKFNFNYLIPRPTQSLFRR
jgi:hypothetical protein